MSFTSLPQPLTASQATVRANYWANKRTDEPNGFAIYFCEDEDAHYVVGYSDTNTIEGINPDLELVDLVESSERIQQRIDEETRLALITAIGR
tara:strand:- start:300 stop:578 length:279 start_codon:yes stop_codon:yes gene_type:complete